MGKDFRRPPGPNSAKYQSSQRAAFRRKRALLRAAGGPPDVPKIFGANTTGFGLIARFGPMRRLNLEGVLGSERVRNFEKTDGAGLTIQWSLPGTRGFGIALDPEFPLFRQVRSLLARLCDVYGLNVDVDMRPSERAIPTSASRESAPAWLFGSPWRTRLLLALELLGGKQRSNALLGRVPGTSFADARRNVAQLVRDGILLHEDGTISFIQAWWTGAFRGLLRAYLKNDPEFGAMVERKDVARQKTTADHAIYGLLAKASTERMLMALATNGPTRITKLSEMIMSRLDEATLKHLKSDGIIATSKTRHANMVSLNAAHPAYAELKRLLIAMAGEKRAARAPQDLQPEQGSHGVAYLFVTSLRLDMLAMLAACAGGEIDASSLLRLLPNHDRGVVRERLMAYEAMGVVAMRRSAGVCLYRLNPDYEFYREFRGLLDRIIRIRPRYALNAEIEERLFVPQRAVRQRKISASRPIGGEKQKARR
jgi:hypothetical protein